MSDITMRQEPSLDAAPRRVSSDRRAATVLVETYSDPRAVLDDWRDLVRIAPGTPYQAPDWLLPWIETVGAEAGIEPLIVVARDAEGRALALLPLGTIRQGRLTVASFLGAKDSNFNLGLFRPGRVWGRGAILGLLHGAVRASGRPIDLFSFRNQPRAWRGAPNPFLALGAQPSPSFAYKARLTRDPDQFFASQLSRESRKKLRQKLNRLKLFGPVMIRRAETADEITSVLDAFVEQRMLRCSVQGLPADDIPVLRRFLDRAVTPAAVGAIERPPVEFHALHCGDRILATLGGVRRAGRFHGMVTSFTADPDMMRTSPGELLLAEVMRLQCIEGFDTFDLGIGEARYKETYCPEVEPLFDSLVPVTPLGHVHARAEALRLQAKRTIKQSRWAWPLVQRLRRLRGLLSGGLPR